MLSSQLDGKQPWVTPSLKTGRLRRVALAVQSFSNSLWLRKLLAGLSAPRQLPFAAHPLNFPLLGGEVQFRILVTGPAFPPPTRTSYFSFAKPSEAGVPEPPRARLFVYGQVTLVCTVCWPPPPSLDRDPEPQVSPA